VFFGILILYGFANIAFFMTVSTFFSDAKLASQNGLLLTIIPASLFLYFMTSKVLGLNNLVTPITDVSDLNHTYGWVYAIIWIPIVPCFHLVISYTDPVTSVFAKAYCTNGFGVTMNCGLIQAHHIPTWVSWTALIVEIPLWYLAYLYFDSVIPNTYGIAKSPCFCLKRSQKIG